MVSEKGVKIPAAVPELLPAASRPSLDASSPSQICQDNVVELHPAAIILYLEREYWKEETTVSKVEDWAVDELTRWIKSCMRRADSISRYCKLLDKPSKYADLIEKLLRVIEQEDIGGGLLLAGGKSYLAEKASYILGSKRDRSRLPHAMVLIFAAIEEAIELHGVVSYWERLWRESAAGQALCEEFNALEGIGVRLRMALKPCPLENVRYIALCHLEAANDVLEADLYVDKDISPADGSRPFKVVSVAPRDYPTVVWSNLIYARNDLDDSLATRKVRNESLGGEDTVVARKGRQRRKNAKRKKKRQWELIASVDFCRHGSASPGHWHLNRTPCDDLIPHLSVSSGEVWHGREDGCPLWWQFIPAGMVYRDTPPRLKVLLDDVANR